MNKCLTLWRVISSIITFSLLHFTTSSRSPCRVLHIIFECSRAILSFKTRDNLGGLDENFQHSCNVSNQYNVECKITQRSLFMCHNSTMCTKKPLQTHTLRPDCLSHLKRPSAESIILYSIRVIVPGFNRFELSQGCNRALSKIESKYFTVSRADYE